MKSISYDIIHEIYKHSDANTKVKLHTMYNIPLGNILEDILKDKNFKYYNNLFKNKKGKIKFFKKDPYPGYTLLVNVNNIDYNNLPEHFIYYLKDKIKFKRIMRVYYHEIKLRPLFCDNCGEYEICPGRSYSLIGLNKEFSNKFLKDFENEIIECVGMKLLIRLKLNNFIKTHLKMLTNII